MNEIILHNGNYEEVMTFIKSINPLQKTRIIAKKDTGKRTLDQNAQAHVWYQQIFDADKQESLLGWEWYCKLHHGVPILRADSEAYRAFYNRAILNTFTYEEKLEAMEFTPVTRMMDKDQFQRYFAALQSDFEKRGIYLKFKNDD